MNIHDAMGGSQAPCKLGKPCNLRVWETPTEGSEIQRYPWLCILFKASLCLREYVILSLRDREGKSLYLGFETVALLLPIVKFFLKKRILDSGFLLCLLVASTYFFEISLTVFINHTFVSLMKLMLLF